MKIAITDKKSFDQLSDLGGVDIMIKTIYVGYQAPHPENFSYHRDTSADEWLLIHTLTPAEFFVSGKWRIYPENQIILYPPHASADYRACNGPYKNNWMTFYTDEKYIVQTAIPFNIPIQISCADSFHHLFHLLAIENYFDYEYREQSIGHLFHLLFDKLSEACHNSSSVQSRENLLALNLEIQSNPGFQWSVPYMAKRLNISPGYMQSLYRKTFGVSCMEDVFNKRIELAKDYLAHSQYTITQIAELCGYQSSEHFFRQFRRLTSTTPSHYRQKVRGEEMPGRFNDTNLN